MKFSKEQIIDLISAYHQNTISDEGMQNLKDWLKINPKNSSEFANYLALLKESDAISQLNKIDKEQAWNNINQSLNKVSKPDKVRRLHQWLPYAAAVVVVAFVSYFMIYQVHQEYDFSKNYNFAEIAKAGSVKAILTLDNGEVMSLDNKLASVITEKDGTLIHKNKEDGIIYNRKAEVKTKLIYNKINVPRGGEYSLTLADGTRVRLNSESSLKYPVQFIGSIRKVELTGEAFFEVAHNADKPFIVKALDNEVKVLGTKFNVSSYSDEEYVATTLVEGSVQVEVLGNTQLLKPGFQAVVKKGDNKFAVNKVNTDLYTSWTTGVFRFKDQSLEEICHQLSRWYDVDFFFTENQYRNLRFSGAAKREKPIDFSLGMIEKMAKVKFAIKDNRIIVGKPNQ